MCLCMNKILYPCVWIMHFPGLNSTHHRTHPLKYIHTRTRKRTRTPHPYPTHTNYTLPPLTCPPKIDSTVMLLLHLFNTSLTHFKSYGKNRCRVTTKNLLHFTSLSTHTLTPAPTQSRPLGHMLLFYLRHHIQRFKLENVHFGPNMFAAGIPMPCTRACFVHALQRAGRV